MQRLLDEGIATRRGVMCIHREPAYAVGAQPCRRVGSLGHSERAQDQGLILPLYHQLSEAEQDEVAAALARACRQFAL
jgi:dTDP-4-amino-4,6-dideoxygalactose transaminase